MAAAGAPRPGNARPPPPGYDPNIVHQNPYSSPNNLQNLNLNCPPPPSMLPNPGSRPPPHFPQPHPSAPPPGPRVPAPFSPLGHAPAALARPVRPTHGAAPPTLPPNVAPGRPGGPSAMQPPFVRPPPTMGPSRAPLQAPSMHSLARNVNTPPSAPPGGPVLSGLPQGFQPPPGSHYGPQTWQMQPGQAAPSPPVGGSMQPPRMFGMPPPLQNQSMTATQPAVGHVGAPVVGSSKIDPNQIPRPIPDSTLFLHETRHDNQANPPPLATSDYIIKDTGNCSPRYMRCTTNQIPCTLDLLNSSGMQLALSVQPLALPHPSEEPIQIVDFGESGPVRCLRCKGYINPFTRFTDSGRRFICNFCGFTEETPRDYLCNLGPDGRRRDIDERPELCRGTVEFVASREYMVRDPMPAVYFFLIDVSMNAIQTGATAAACSAISQVLSDLAEGPRTMVGTATFDSTIHFYNLRHALQQPLMLIVPDVKDVYTPLQTDVIVQLSECRQHLEFLLGSIPNMFQDNKTADSAFGAAVMAAFLALKTTGGKLLVFQSVLPSIGIGALSAREAEGRSNVSAGEKETQMLLQPADKTLKSMAIEIAEYQVCVDVFITSVTYVDIASISVIPATTGGQVYYYYPFSAISDSAKLYNDLRWNVIRPQGFEAVLRVRCSQGIQVEDYFGNFCRRIPTDVDLPGIDCDKTIMVTLMHEDRLQDGLECSYQSALLYTTLNGQRRIRVSTLSLTCTNTLSNLFHSADLDAQFACILKQVAFDIPSYPLLHIREQITGLCIKVLLSYRKFCAALSTSGQLILPEALKLLPLYSLALIKSTGLRSDGRIDDRSFWISYVASLSTPLTVPLVYPRMVAIHNLNSKEDESLIPPVLSLSSENVNEEGIFLLENGEDCLIYIGNSVDTEILQKLFGTTIVDEIPSQLVLQQHDNPLSRKFNDLVNEIRRQRCSYLRIKMCRKGDPTGVLFFSYMIEDKNQTASSYMEFLVHIHRQILMKMSR